jgi:hypothetical protein
VGLFYLSVVCRELFVIHTVRKNCLEKFFTSDSEPVGSPTGKWAIIPYIARKNKQLSDYLVAAFLFPFLFVFDDVKQQLDKVLVKSI